MKINISGNANVTLSKRGVISEDYWQALLSEMGISEIPKEYDHIVLTVTDVKLSSVVKPKPPPDAQRTG